MCLKKGAPDRGLPTIRHSSEAPCCRDSRSASANCSRSPGGHGDDFLKALFVTAAIHPAALPVEELLADCDVRRTRRSGPGGQRRNKVETAVTIVHRPTTISAEASERRSQAENCTLALFRLRL